MVEMSLILPILILMLLAVVDLGLLLQGTMAVSDSARAGAAYALPWGNATDTAGMVAAATASAGPIPGYTAAAANVCLCSPAGSAVSCANRCGNGNFPAEYAQLSATANLPLLFEIRGLPASLPVASVARMRVTWIGAQ